MSFIFDLSTNIQRQTLQRMYGICWQLNEGSITTINHLIQFNAYLVIKCSWCVCVCFDFITSELPLGWSIYFIATIWLKFFLPSMTFGLVIASAGKNQWSGEFLVCSFRNWKMYICDIFILCRRINIFRWNKFVSRLDFIA